MTYRTSLLFVALFVFLLAGCQAQNDFQKKWPEYPKWGWWEHPARNVPEPADEAPKEEPPSDAPRKKEVHADAKADSPDDAPRTPATLEEHRADVWEKVSILRDVEELPPEQQRKLIQSARRDLRKWYRPMAVDPPDSDDPRWITVLVWDFMPEEDFEQAEKNWRETARRENLPFPEDPTRRELMEFIGNVIRGEIQPAATTQPTTSPAAGKSALPAEEQ